jgi:hypothetical protein
LEILRYQRQRRARILHPDVYQSYQQFNASSPTNEQWNRRAGYGLAKSASTYENLVATEIRKGCNYEIAAQRVAQAHGFRALDSSPMMKSQIVGRFERKVNSLIAKGYDGTTACQIVREADPLLYKAMQIV